MIFKQEYQDYYQKIDNFESSCVYLAVSLSPREMYLYSKVSSKNCILPDMNYVSLLLIPAEQYNDCEGCFTSKCHNFSRIENACE